MCKTSATHPKSQEKTLHEKQKTVCFSDIENEHKKQLRRIGEGGGPGEGADLQPATSQKQNPKHTDMIRCPGGQASEPYHPYYFPATRPPFDSFQLWSEDRARNTTNKKYRSPRKPRSNACKEDAAGIHGDTPSSGHLRSPPHSVLRLTPTVIAVR